MRLLSEKIRKRAGRTIPLILLLALLGGCSTPAFIEELYGVNPEPSVNLTYHRAAYRCSILVQDMKVPVTILPPADIPYSDQAFAGIQVGYNFPYEHFKEIMTWARNYYKEARYIMLTDPAGPGARKSHFTMHLGVRTDRAFKQGWRAWSNEDFNRIRSISSQEDMRQLLLSFKTEPSPLPYQENEGRWWQIQAWPFTP
ncbi:MAG TPA: hypothetical protein DEA96_12455 [Leptospiraceae bacterium]|nr:hypothetical protein [Spirochaetaceae bacterium]HBS05773.1 hypothetical protein [Leptospiraceae bacterium]